MDLWPDDLNEPLDLESPFKIISEQAKLLGEKTNNIVTAEVLDTKFNSANDSFSFIFFLSSGLRDYRFRLFDFQFPIDFYPVYMTIDADVQEEYQHDFQRYEKTRSYIVVPDQENLQTVLELIFKSGKTKRIISALKQINN